MISPKILEVYWHLLEPQFKYLFVELTLYDLSLPLDYRVHDVRHYVYFIRYHLKMKIEEKVRVKEQQIQSRVLNVSLRLSGPDTV